MRRVSASTSASSPLYKGNHPDNHFPLSKNVELTCPSALFVKRSRCVGLLQRAVTFWPGTAFRLPGFAVTPNQPVGFHLRFSKNVDCIVPSFATMKRSRCPTPPGRHTAVIGCPGAALPEVWPAWNHSGCHLPFSKKVLF